MLLLLQKTVNWATTEPTKPNNRCGKISNYRRTCHPLIKINFFIDKEPCLSHRNTKWSCSTFYSGFFFIWKIKLKEGLILVSRTLLRKYLMIRLLLPSVTWSTLPRCSCLPGHVCGRVKRLNFDLCPTFVCRPILAFFLLRKTIRTYSLARASILWWHVLVCGEFLPFVSWHHSVKLHSPWFFFNFKI